MKILGVGVLERFKAQHPIARKALAKWERVVEEVSWQNFSEVRSTFASASYVDRKTIFNVGGNKYRVTTVIGYKAQSMLLDKIETHPVYTREGRRK